MTQVIVATANRLAARGHDVTVLADSRGDRAALDPAVALVERPTVGGLRYAAVGFTIARALQSQAVFDVMHSHFAYSSIGPRLALRTTPVHVRTYHGSWDLETVADAAEQEAPSRFGRLAGGLGGSVRFATEKLDLAGSCPIVALSEYSSAQLRERFHISESKLVKLQGGVDAEQFSPRASKTHYRNLIGHSGQRPLIFTAGRLVRRKGFDRLIAAWPTVLTAVPGAVLLIGGDGPERPYLQTIIESRGLSETVRLLGHLSDSIADHYRAADLFVLPSQGLETFGLVTIEALASGTPVIGTASGATPEILAPLDERLIAPAGTPEELAGAVIRFFTGTWRETLTPERLSAYASSTYSWDDHVTKLEAIYDRGKESRC